MTSFGARSAGNDLYCDSELEVDGEDPEKLVPKNAVVYPSLLLSLELYVVSTTTRPVSFDR